MVQKTLTNSNRSARLLGLFVVMFALIAAFAAIMTAELNRNEHMYLAASVFVSRGQTVYKDFAYLQTPYLPLLYGVAYKVFGVSSYYLLIARIFSFVFECLSAGLLFIIARRVLKDGAMPLCIVALFLLNMTILRPASEISNYILPVALSFAAYHLFTIWRDNATLTAMVFAGFFVALAIGTKLTYAGVIVAFPLAVIAEAVT